MGKSIHLPRFVQSYSLRSNVIVAAIVFMACKEVSAAALAPQQATPFQAGHFSRHADANLYQWGDGLESYVHLHTIPDINAINSRQTGET
jgi:hypothetical protein